MSTPAVIEMTTHYQGDRWLDGCREFGPVLIDGASPADPCLYAEMRIVNRKTKAVGYTLKSSNAIGGGRITIVDQNTYQFLIDDTEEALPLETGTYDWAFSTYRTVDASDLPLTIWVGSIKINPKV